MIAKTCPIFLLLVISSAAYKDSDLYEPPPIAPRRSWLARPPHHPLVNNPLPASQVIIDHTGTEECFTHAECMERVLHIQQFQQEAMELDDIIYNFLVGGDGAVYVARGWNRKGGHNPGPTLGTVDVALVGDFVYKLPSDKQFQALRQLVDIGLVLGKIQRNYTLLANCQLQPSSSPGLALMAELSTWPNFDAPQSSQCTEFDDF